MALQIAALFYALPPFRRLTVPPAAQRTVRLFFCNYPAAFAEPLTPYTANNADGTTFFDESFSNLFCRRFA